MTEPRSKRSSKKRPTSNSADEAPARSKRKRSAAEDTDERPRKSSRSKSSAAADPPQSEGRSRRSSKPAESKRTASESKRSPSESKRKRGETGRTKREERGESRREPRQSSRRGRREDDDDGGSDGGGSKLKLIVLIILAVGVIGTAAFFTFVPPNLPTLISRLDDFKVPSSAHKNSAYKRSPIKDLVDYHGSTAVGPCEQVLLDEGAKPNARVGAAIALGRLRDKGGDKAAPALAKMVAGKDEQLAEFSGFALAYIGAPGIKPLGDEAMAATDDAIAIRCVDFLLRQKRLPSLPEFRRIALTHARPAVRIAGIKALKEVTSPKAVTVIALGLDDGDPEVRSAAEQALATREEKMLLDGAKDMWDTDDEKQQVLAMRVLRNVGKRATEMLEKGLGSSRLSVAVAAAPGLAAMVPPVGSKEADPAARKTFVGRLEVLLGMSKDPNQLFELGQATGRGKLHELSEHFGGWLASKDKGQRLAAIEAIAGLGERYGPGQLIPYVNDSDPDVSKAILLGLQRLYLFGRKNWFAIHMPARKGTLDPPTDPAGWISWWKDQKWIHEKDVEIERVKNAAVELIKTRKFKPMKKAKEMLEGARELLIQIGEKNGVEQDDRIVKDINGLIEMSIKLRPVNEND